MASAYWRTNHTVGTLLNEREVGWEFLQLVKLLLSISAESAANDADSNQAFGQGYDDKKILSLLSENINFQASLASDFPPGEIRSVQKNTDTQKTDVVLSTGTLSTKDGPLPEPFVAWLRELTSQGDDAMADFVDLFNNRLMALRYLICRATRPNLIDTEVSESHTGQLLYALSGALFNRQPLDSDLRLSGILSNQRMSFPAIKQLFLFDLGLALKKVNYYQGGWIKVDKQDHSFLGSPKTCILGKTVSLGTKVWDQQKTVEFIVGPLMWNKASTLLPGSEGYKSFCDLLARVTDCRCDCRIVLQVYKNRLPEVQLGGTITDLNVVAIDDNSKPTGMALGLSTVLPTAIERLQAKDIVDLSFTVKTSEGMHNHESYGALG